LVAVAALFVIVLCKPARLVGLVVGVRRILLMALAVLVLLDKETLAVLLVLPQVGAAEVAAP
jgi:hypothetical protein